MSLSEMARSAAGAPRLPLALAFVAGLTGCAAGSTLITDSPSRVTAVDDNAPIHFVVDEVRTADDLFEFDEGEDQDLAAPIEGMLNEMTGDEGGDEVHTRVSLSRYKTETWRRDIQVRFSTTLPGDVAVKTQERFIAYAFGWDVVWNGVPHALYVTTASFFLGPLGALLCVVLGFFFPPAWALIVPLIFVPTLGSPLLFWVFLGQALAGDAPWNLLWGPSPDVSFERIAAKHIAAVKEAMVGVGALKSNATVAETIIDPSDAEPCQVSLNESGTLTVHRGDKMGYRKLGFAVEPSAVDSSSSPKTAKDGPEGFRLHKFETQETKSGDIFAHLLFTHRRQPTLVYGMRVPMACSWKVVQFWYPESPLELWATPLPAGATAGARLGPDQRGPPRTACFPVSVSLEGNKKTIAGYRVKYGSGVGVPTSVYPRRRKPGEKDCQVQRSPGPAAYVTSGDGSRRPLGFPLKDASPKGFEMETAGESVTIRVQSADEHTATITDPRLVDENGRRARVLSCTASPSQANFCEKLKREEPASMTLGFTSMPLDGSLPYVDITFRTAPEARARLLVDGTVHNHLTWLDDD